MKLKLYSLVSILFLVVVGVYVFLNNNEFYSLNIYTFSLNLPIAIWVVLPAFGIFVGSLLHMVFYGLKGFLDKKSFEKDTANLTKVVFDAISGNETSVEVKNKLLRPSFIAIKNSQINPIVFTEKTQNQDLDSLLAECKRLKDGEIADFAKLKIPANSSLRKQNALLKLSKDKKYAENIFKRYPNDKALCASAINALASFADRKKIEKFKHFLDKPATITLLSRYKAQENEAALSLADFIAYIKPQDFNSQDFIKLAKSLRQNLSPEDALELLYELKREFVEATESWMYTNLEYERYDEVKDLLDASLPSEYLPFRKYLAVKNAHIQTNLDEFLNID